MTRTQAIVFDMDGVLIDSEELHAHAKRIALRTQGSRCQMLICAPM